MATERSAELLGTNGVAQLLQVHPKHVYRLLKRGMPAMRLGGEWRFDSQAVLAWMRRNEAETSPAPTAYRPVAPPLLAANGDVCVELLLDLLGRGAHRVGLVQADRTSGLAYVQQGTVLAAGVHGSTAAEADALVRIHVTRRTVCVATPKGKRLRSLRGLSGLRLASRGPTAGVRAHLSQALTAAHLDEQEIHRTAAVHASHRDVALSVLSGNADAGIMTTAWAERAGLASLPIAEEDYALCFRADALEHAVGRALIGTLQGPALKRALTRLAGCDPRGIGTFVGM